MPFLPIGGTVCAAEISTSCLTGEIHDKLGCLSAHQPECHLSSGVSRWGHLTHRMWKLPPVSQQNISRSWTHTASLRTLTHDLPHKKVIFEAESCWITALMTSGLSLVMADGVGTKTRECLVCLSGAPAAACGGYSFTSHTFRMIYHQTAQRCHITSII